MTLVLAYKAKYTIEEVHCCTLHNLKNLTTKVKWDRRGFEWLNKKHIFLDII